MSQHAVKLDEYLSPDFKPETIAASLLKATTTPQDSSVDIAPTLTRLKYDLDEIDKSMARVARANTAELLAHANAVEEADAKVAKLSPALENVTSTFAKLENDFLTPHRRAQQLYSAAKNLHDYATLSRGLSYYLQLALQAQNQDFKRDSVIVKGGAGAALHRSAQALHQMHELLAAMPQLEELEAVARFQARVADLHTSVLDSANAVVREFSSKDRSHLKLAMLALRTLGVDLQHTADTYLKSQVGTTVLQLSRQSGTTDGFQRAFEDAKARAATVDVVGGVLADTQPSVVSVSAPRFWTQVTAQLDQKLRTMSVANPTAIKAMSAIGETILSTTQAVEGVQTVFKKYIA